MMMMMMMMMLGGKYDVWSLNIICSHMDFHEHSLNLLILEIIITKKYVNLLITI